MLKTKKRPEECAKQRTHNCYIKIQVQEINTKKEEKMWKRERKNVFRLITYTFSIFGCCFYTFLVKPGTLFLFSCSRVLLFLENNRKLMQFCCVFLILDQRYVRFCFFLDKITPSNKKKNRKLCFAHVRGR